MKTYNRNINIENSTVIGVVLLVLPLIIFFLQGELSAQPAFKAGSRIGIPWIQDGRAYFGTESGTIFCIEASKAEEVWTFQAAGPILNRPILYENNVIVGGQDGVLRSIDAAIGNQRWSFQCGEVDWEVRDIFVNGWPTMVDSIAIFSSEDHNVYAIHSGNGREKWRARLGEEPQALEIPVVDGVAYIGAWDGYLYAIDIRDGRIIWKSDTDSDHLGETVNGPNGHIWRSKRSGGETLPNQAPYVTVVPIITGDKIYFTDWSGNLMAVSRSRGKQLWRFRPSTADGRHVGSRHYFAMYNDWLYYATIEDKHLYCVDRNSGQKVWEMTSDGWLMGPLPGNERISILAEISLDHEGRPAGFQIKAFDMHSRDLLWRCSQISSFPTTMQSGAVLYGGIDGTLHAIDLLTGEEVWELGRALPALLSH